ncbi:VOC family protein [Rhizobium sp. WL3]|uniref:VOC family protein n=1 Tax=Rhizobium sp. WL3 TaxID=2603277 RepID=UPI001FEFFEFE|nr:VOC family protein [Rhizobium sp. WL3]
MEKELTGDGSKPVIASFDLASTPLHLGSVRLRVRDLVGMAEFYRTAIGLQLIGEDKSEVILGSGSRPLLVLRGDPGLSRRDPREAGLFHIAFLLPSRADLARWLAYANSANIRLQGVADHLVSEALYLADPEGNGIEIYVDREPSRWRNEGGDIIMTADPLDTEDLLAQQGARGWTSFPEAGCVGHVHLQTGDLNLADQFFRGLLGFDVTFRYHGACFFGSGGYHHQIAANIWNSKGAGMRTSSMAGLDAYELRLLDPDTKKQIKNRATAMGVQTETRDGALVLYDPWGTQVTLLG